MSAEEVRGSGGKGCATSAVQSPGIPGQEEGNLSLEICVRLQTLQPRFAIALETDPGPEASSSEAAQFWGHLPKRDMSF